MITAYQAQLWAHADKAGTHVLNAQGPQTFLLLGFQNVQNHTYMVQVKTRYSSLGTVQPGKDGQQNSPAGSPWANAQSCKFHPQLQSYPAAFPSILIREQMAKDEICEDILQRKRQEIETN